jgi:hypothetical protein
LTVAGSESTSTYDGTPGLPATMVPSCFSGQSGSVGGGTHVTDVFAAIVMFPRTFSPKRCENARSACACGAMANSRRTARSDA